MAEEGGDESKRVTAAGLTIVLALHAAVLGWLWNQRLIPGPGEAVTLFVDFVAPPAPKTEEAPKPPPATPKPVEMPKVRQLAVEAPATTPMEYAALAPPAPAPVAEAPPAPPAAKTAAGPVSLGTELSVSCPERIPPAYPAFSRRVGEEGTVTLRVELDEQGLVSSAKVASSSGYPRLDDAALTAVRTWRCNPAQRMGLPVRAIALQPFKFVLQGN